MALLRFFALTFLAATFFSSFGFAVIKKENITYMEEKTQLQGVLIYDDANKAARPGVVLVHNWMGIGDDVIIRAEQLARMGHIAFVADIYGEGVKPKDAQEAGKISGGFKADRNLLRARGEAAYNVLAKHKLVQKGKIAAIGYCFGGTTVLEMARAGLPLAGVVSFHGGLDNPKPSDAKKIKAKVLVAHGAIDPYVPPAQVDQFQKEMNEAKVDYQFIAYSGAVHAFTEKAAGKDIAKGAAYNEAADRRSFEAMKNFFAEIF